MQLSTILHGVLAKPASLRLESNINCMLPCSGNIKEIVGVFFLFFHPSFVVRLWAVVFCSFLFCHCMASCLAGWLLDSQSDDCCWLHLLFASLAVCCNCNEACLTAFHRNFLTVLEHNNKNQTPNSLAGWLTGCVQDVDILLLLQLPHPAAAPQWPSLQSPQSGQASRRELCCCCCGLDT